MSDPHVVRAAGGIVTRGDGDDRRFAIVHRPRYDDWSFPKGKLAEGEEEPTAALREVFEETGLRCRLVRHLGAVTYTDHAGRPKIVRYWTMTADDGAFAPNAEVDDLRWLDADGALATLSYEHDRELLRSVVEAASSPVYVIRHAKAGQRQRWSGPDEARPLTRRGRRQSARLVERFAGIALERIVSSPYVRCVQTVEPLAAAHGLEVEHAIELAEGADLGEATRFVRGLDDRVTAICGHGREIEAIVGELRRDDVAVERSGGLAKGSVWLLERREGAIVSARYLPPPRA